MRITKNDLQNFGLLASLPPVFNDYKDGEYFVFYYNTIDAESKLKIFTFEVALSLNVGLYRKFNELSTKGLVKQGESMQIGYFAFDSFESRSGLFYLFLNTYCEPDALQRFYAWCVNNDVAGDLAISTSAMNEIYERGNFERVLAFFLMGRRIASVMTVYDMMDEHMRKVMGKSLYGGYIKKVVQLIPYEGGVLPERNGEMRFMIIGEKALLTDTEKEKLELAKSYLRSLKDPVEIYKATGWYFNERDGKWRHNLSDKGVFISPLEFSEVDGKKMYNPKINPLGLEVMEKLFKKPQELYRNNYLGKLSDVLYHPEIYRRYPQVARIPLLYCDNPKATKFEFYYMANAQGGYMVINGNSEKVNLASVMVHETQHAVQRIEGFATGGNTFLATFVMSVGGENIRKIFYNIKMLEAQLVDKCSEKWVFDNIKNIVSRLYSNPKVAEMKENLVSYTQDFDMFMNNVDSFALYTTFYLTAIGQLASGEFIEFLSDITNGAIYELTETVADGLMKADDIGHKLLGEGFTQDDVRRIMFNAYQDLMVETGSRSVQHGMMFEGDLANYFYLYDWEKSPTQKIAVISNDYIEVNSHDIFGAVERTGDDYILHFKQAISTEPFLHELAHIVDDMLVEMGHGTLIQSAYDETQTKKSRSEYFVDCFLGFVRDNIADENIWDDLSENMDLKNHEAIDSLLGEVFGVQPQAQEFAEGGNVNDEKFMSYSASGDSREKVTYIAPKMAKSNFIKLIQYYSISGVEGATWISKRMSESGNEEHRKILNENPNCMVILKDDKIENIIKL